MPTMGTMRPDIKMMIPIPETAKVYGSVIAEQIRTVDFQPHQRFLVRFSFGDAESAVCCSLR